MSKTFKHYAGQACLVAAILFFTVSCEKEEVIITETAKSPIAVKTIDSSVIEQNTNLFESISNLNAGLKRNKAKKGKSDGFSEDYDFVINTEVANYITNNNNGYHSYTFVIEREETNSHIENIIFSLKEDGSYLTHLVTYYTTQQQKEAFILGELIDLDGVRGGFKEIVIDSRNNFNDDYACEDPDSWDCILYAYEAFIGSDGDGKCYTVSTNGSFPVFVETPCLTEDGGNMGTGQGAGDDPGGNIYPNGKDSGTGNYPGGGNTTTGGNTNTGGNTVTTSPLPPRIIFNAPFRNFVSGLSQQQQDFVNGFFVYGLKVKLYEFLNHNGYTVENQNIAIGIIDISMENLLFSFEDAIKIYVYGELVDVVVEGPDTPIDDMVEYLSCFDTSINASSAKITIYVDEPVNGSNKLVGPDGVGYTFISIEQGNNIASFGFYPDNGLSSLFNSVNGVMGNNSNTSFDVSLTIGNVSSNSLRSIINLAIAYSNSDYSLYGRNCTDLGIYIANLAGLPMPQCNADPIYFCGSTPGRAGEYIRNLSPPQGVTKNENGGTSPSNNCN